jgi:15-cis-phytoene synthase
MSGAAVVLRAPEPTGDPELVRRELARVAEWGIAEGVAGAALEGQLIRPLVALAGWRALSVEAPPPAFWNAVLAVQLAHEASLLHDDVVDGSDRRRGAPTLAARAGVAAALVQGDHLLTTAYRYAARSGSPAFVELFARSVERTVAGEIRQARATGRMLEMAEYRAIATGKAGELLGCALAAGAALLAPERVERLHALGCDLGLAYQMLDDLLDLCPATDTGKPPLSDYAQRHWTWPLDEIGVGGFDLAPAELRGALHLEEGAGSGLARCLGRYLAAVQMLERRIAVELGAAPGLLAMTGVWRSRARSAVSAEVAAVAAERDHSGPTPSLLANVPAEDGVFSYLARHSRSFRFATRFFPRADEERVARVYAYCRCTDDLADAAGLEAGLRAALLAEWLELSRRAYHGGASGIPFLDRVMGEMAQARVPFRYAEELVEGMRMDLRGERYASMTELGRYTYRVASVVGLWICELFDVRDPQVLQRAEAMGHAMQLTNILRDVGEDLRAGRCYLPAELMQRHGVHPAGLNAGAPLPPGYPAMLEELMAAAEAAYRVGFAGIPSLPRALQLPVAVAAHVYRGILDEIRRNGHDNLSRRARTSGARKAALAAQALLELRSASRRQRSGASPPLPTERTRSRAVSAR